MTTSAPRRVCSSRYSTSSSPSGSNKPGKPITNHLRRRCRSTASRAPVPRIRVRRRARRQAPPPPCDLTTQTQITHHRARRRPTARRGARSRRQRSQHRSAYLRRTRRRRNVRRDARIAAQRRRYRHLSRVAREGVQLVIPQSSDRLDVASPGDGDRQGPQRAGCHGSFAVASCSSCVCVAIGAKLSDVGSMTDEMGQYATPTACVSVAGSSRTASMRWAVSAREIE
jgi:hypothetical protein